MPKQLFKPCEYCYVEHVRCIPNVPVDNEGITEYQHQIEVVYSIRDDQYNKLMPNQCSILVANTTLERIDTFDSVTLFASTNSQQLLINEIKRLKLKNADYTLTDPK